MNETNKPQPTEIGRRFGIGICSRKFIVSLANPATVAAIVAGLREWEAMVKKFEDSLFPEHAAVRLRSEIDRCTCPIELPKLVARLAAAKSTDRSSVMAAIGLVNSFRSERMDLHLKDFFLQTSQELLNRIAECTEMETSFFAQFGLPEQATPVRNQLLAIARELNHMAKLDEQSPVLMSLGSLQHPNRARWIDEGCKS